MNSDLLTPNVNPAKYIDVIPAFEDFDERNNDCDECPFYGEECSGDGDKRCLSADVLELLKRGRDLEMDAEPVRHARWIPCYEPIEVFIDAMCNTEIRDVQTGWVCSECGRHGYGKTLKEMPYCHCGAKMQGDAE